MPFDVELPLTPRDGWWLAFIFQVACIATGVVLLLRVPAWRFARLNLFTLWAWASSLAVMTWTDGQRGTVFEATASMGFFAFAYGTSIWMLQGFTALARPVPKVQRALAVAATLAVVWGAAFHTVVPHAARQHRLAVLNSLAIVAVMLLALIRAHRRSNGLERRQIRWVILGFYVAFLGGIVARFLVAYEIWTPGRYVAAITSLGIPAGMLVSVIGYHWLDIDRLISAAASYTIVGLALLGAALAGAPRLASAAAPIVGVDRAAAQWLLSMAFVAAAIPMHRWLSQRIDRRMFAERHRRTLGFESLLDEVGRIGSVGEMVRRTGERVDELLLPESIVVYGREGAAFAPLFVRGRDPPSSIESDSLLVRALERRGRPLSVDAAELDAFDRAALETLGASLIVPTRGRDGIAGIACLGRKRSGDIYTPEEIAQLTAVSNRCSEILLRLAERPAPPEAGEPAPIFRREGEAWTIAAFGKEIRLRDMRGLHYLATLLREPGREFHSSDLIGAAAGAGPAPWVEDPELSVVVGLGDAGEALDAQARMAYRDRLRVLEGEQADAERCSDLARLERISAEREALLAELEGVVRGRHLSPQAERARIAVTKALKTALERIAERHPELGAHLSATIRRGNRCAYIPDPHSHIEWET